MVDSNVLLDLVTEDEHWFEWSRNALESCAEESIVCINPVIYAEVSVGFQRIEELEAALPARLVERVRIPYEVAFLAAKCFLDSRRRGGQKRSALPDFFIGAHAAVEPMTLLTRNGGRYATYSPHLDLIYPEG